MTFDTGQQIVSRVLVDGTPKPFLDQGWDLEWASDPENILRMAVFTGTHLDAWCNILRHWDKYNRTPPSDLFGREFPGYELTARPASPDELVDLAAGQIKMVAVQDAMGDLAQLQEEEDWDAISSRISRLSAQLQGGRTGSKVIIWDEAGHDVEARLRRIVKFGIGTGIDKIDSQEGFIGFQAGNLITYLGRAKAGKTSFGLLASLDAALRKFKRVMVVTFEISAEDIHDRFDAYAANVSLTRLRQGKLKETEKDRVRKTYLDRGDYEPLMYIVEPHEKYSVTNLEADIDKYQPDVVLIDGFYFMTDRISGKLGSHPDGHDGLSAELKRSALRRNIVVIVTHQVREKQLKGKKGSGIDDQAMMSGTGLIMASDMVIGLDASEDHEHLISCTRSRTGYLDKVRGTWNWDTCVFEAFESEEDYAQAE